MAKVGDEINSIILYESGDLDNDEMLNLFSRLVKNGMAWTLQEHYGRTAQSLIDNGYLSKTGKILKIIE